MDRVVYWLYRLVAHVIEALPIEAGFRIGWVLGTIASHVAPQYRALVLRNLRIAFGTEKSEAELRKLAGAHFATLGGNLFASIKLPTLSREELLARVDVEGLEIIDDAAAQNVGLVMPISHLGNWELFAQLSPVVFKCKAGTVYQRLGNGQLDAEVRRARARLGLELFERKEGFSAAARFIRSGGAVGILADQHAGDAGLWCPFFNRLASTSTLAATLALRTDGWLVSAAVYTVGVARWRCVFGPRIENRGEDVATLTGRINRVLEAQIRQQPADWFWVHNRWKLPRPKFLLATYKRGVALEEGARDRLQPFRIVVRSSNWLGDAVMSAPAVRAIKRGRPDAHVTILTPAKLSDFWVTVPEVDAIVNIAAGDSPFAVARQLRGKFEAAILFPNSFRAGLEAFLARIPRRVGYPGHRRTALLNQVLRPKKPSPAPRPLHHADRFLALAEFIGAEVKPVAPSHETAPRPRGNGQAILGLCPGAEYGPAKRWPPERFAEVMRTLHERYRCSWKVFGVAKDRSIADAILGETRVPATDLVGKTTLAELIRELQSCALLITNDTGTMHLAAHLGVPVVAIFGSTEPALTRPLGAGHSILRHHVECSPCFLRECPIDFRCMRAVTAEEVVHAVEEVLQRETHPLPA